MPGLSKWVSDNGDSPSMVLQALTVYFISTIGMVILMLNLLISVLSENYDRTREGQEKFRVQEMADMNVEASIFN